MGAIEAVISSDAEVRFAPGGLDGLRDAYGLAFGKHRVLPQGYGKAHRALADGEVDIIVDFPVHPIVHQRDLVELVDDRGFFSAYHAAPVVRREFLEHHAGVRPLIERLAGRVDNQTMARLNFEMDVHGRSPADVAVTWLRGAGLLEGQQAHAAAPAPPG